MIYILDIINEKLVEAEIIPLEKKDVPLKKEGWKFNWREATRNTKLKPYVLKLKNEPKTVEGAVLLKIEEEMLIMDILEIAPHNVGQKKKYDYVAGTLIAYSCRESFKLGGNYKGFLTFVAKTKLIGWYMEKYGAQLALGQRMFIDWEMGKKLVEEYLNRKER